MANTFPSSGNVGIGTASPGVALEVHGFNFLTDPTVQYNSHFPWVDNNAYVTGEKIHLRGGAPQNWKEALTVDGASGNVGIGTASPGVTLEVHGFNFLTDPTVQYNSHFPWVDNNAYVTGEKIHLRGGAPQNWQEALTVDGASGNVGIGTSSPGVTLEVHGFNFLTDPTVQYNSHFPWVDNNAYVTGEKIHLRGGAPQNWKELLTVDSINENVNVNGDLHIAAGKHIYVGGVLIA